jgi:Bax protein
MTSRARSLLDPARLASLFVPVAIALLLHATVLAPLREERGVQVPLKKVRAYRAEQLDELFTQNGYQWPPQGEVPRFAVRRLPVDLDSLTVDARKALFFRLALPLIVAENERVAKERELLLVLFAGDDLPPGSVEYRAVAAIARHYEVDGDVNGAATRALLLRRVDAIPVALALAQAADESAWGTSRFSREGNSLFGQWTWVRGEGLVPLRRAPGKGHLVRSFPELREGVRAYFYNLNVGHAYGEFRRRREQLRQAGRALDPMVLAGGLFRYSERGKVYVDEIRWLMQDNELPSVAETAVLRGVSD